MSARTTVERVDLESTPKEIDFKIDSNSSGILATDFATALKATENNPEILITDLVILEDQTFFSNPNFKKASRCKGIFELTGDELRYCVAAPGQPRPTGFAAFKGSGHTLVTLKPFKSDEQDSVFHLMKFEANTTLSPDLNRWLFSEINGESLER